MLVINYFIKLEVREYAKKQAKHIQLKSFLQEDLFMNFEKGMGTKHWIILKSNKENLIRANGILAQNPSPFQR